jgi:type II secretory pathway pseudopilin PulG
MTRQTSQSAARHPGEQGYILLMVVVLVALLLIAMAVAAPKMKKAIQRDQEVELKHRGMQYARGVKLYYRKFNSYPVSLDQLMNTNTMKFLRKKYSDPVTGKKEWRLVYYGQVGTGGNPNPNCSTSGSSFGGSPGSSASQLGGNTFSGSQVTGTSGGTSSIGSGSPSIFGSSSSNCDASSTTTGTSTGTDASGNPVVNPNGGTGTSGDTSSSSPSGFASSSPSSGFQSSSPSSGFGSSSGSSGSTFGQMPGSGGPIVGVASLSKKESIMTIKGKNHYNDLEFIYDPSQDYGGMGGMTGTGIAGNNTTTTPGGFGMTGSPGATGTPGGFTTGNSPGSTGSTGNSGGSGSTGSGGIGTTPSQ